MLVPESEKENYSIQYPNPILTIPDSEEGLGRVRNWILDNFREEIIIMVDDDIKYFYCLSGVLTERISDKEKFLQILINTAVMAKDLEVCCFGYSQTDIRKYKGYEPFVLSGWVGCIIGIIGRKYRFRDDKYKVDIDYCLQTLLNERVIWIDSRYYAAQLRDNNMGGNSIWRTQEAFNASIESLKAKWKGCLRIAYVKTQVHISFTFKRRGAIHL